MAVLGSSATISFDDAIHTRFEPVAIAVGESATTRRASMDGETVADGAAFGPVVRVDDGAPLDCCTVEDCSTGEGVVSIDGVEGAEVIVMIGVRVDGAVFD